MPHIFISYRRADSVSVTGRIFDRLVTAFGDAQVFKDVDDIPIGADFRQVLQNELKSCDVQLVIIGATWAAITNPDGKRRLLDPNDFVRIEVETGLKQPNLLVVPVLVQNAAMPGSSDLPDSLHELLFRNAISVREDPDFNHDMDRLIHQLERYFASGAAAAPALAPQERKSARPAARTVTPRMRLVRRFWWVLPAVVILGLVVVLAISALSNNADTPPPSRTPDTQQSTGITPSPVMTLAREVPKPAAPGVSVTVIADTRMSFINVRSGPGSSYTALGSVEDLSQVVYYPDTTTYDGWVWVEQKSLGGWVNTEFVTFKNVSS